MAIAPTSNSVYIFDIDIWGQTKAALTTHITHVAAMKTTLHYLPTIKQQKLQMIAESIRRYSSVEATILL